MMDPKVISIMVAGYSETQAKEALADNDGDVDDAIDSLFLKGRKSQRNVASRPTFDDEDVTVTDDSLAPTPASSGTTIVAGQFSQTRRSSDAPTSHATPSLGAAVFESSTAGSVRGNSSAAARRSPRGVDVDPETGLIPPPKAPPRGSSNGKGLWVEETKETDSVGADTATKSALWGHMSLSMTVFPGHLRLVLIVPWLLMTMMT